eukprot:6658889-Pyramimonas_sp.AAC.1
MCGSGPTDKLEGQAARQVETRPPGKADGQNLRFCEVGRNHAAQRRRAGVIQHIGAPAPKPFPGSRHNQQVTALISQRALPTRRNWNIEARGQRTKTFDLLALGTTMLQAGAWAATSSM